MKRVGLKHHRCDMCIATGRVDAYLSIDRFGYKRVAPTALTVQSQS